MEHKQPKQPKFITEIEDQLKDKLTTYLVVIEYDGIVYPLYNSSCTAYGMAQLVMEHVVDAWNSDFEEVDE